MIFLDLPFFESALRGLMAFICKFLYQLIAWTYNLFMSIAGTNILSQEYVKPIYQRVTMLITIVMIFYVTFQCVKYVVQPDNITDKEQGAGKIIYKMIAVVVLIAFVPKIFDGAMWVQDTVMHNDLIGKIILGQKDDSIKDFGNNFSANILGLFYKFEADPANDIEEDEDCGGITCEGLVATNLAKLRDEGTLKYLNLGINNSKEVKTESGRTDEIPLISFNYFFAVCVGALVLYMLILYCIDTGVRWAQLVFLQIIAPIPIIGYLSPKKDGIFQKWAQQCLTTYLDLFIRVAIIYFVLLVCQVLSNAWMDGELFGGIEAGGMLGLLTYVALIMGLMLFAKKAPSMLQELFPKKGAASGNFGLKAGERIAPMVARTAGAALGATRAIGGAIGRGVRRAARNKANGQHRRLSKEGKEQRRNRKANKRMARQLGKEYDEDKKASNQMRKNVSDKDVAAGKERVQKANANLNAAKAELDKAKSTGDSVAIQKAQNKVNTAQTALDNETKNYKDMMDSRRNVSGISEAKERVAQANSNARDKEKKLRKAEEKLDNAYEKGDEKEIQAAQAEKEQAEKEKLEADEKLKHETDRYGTIFKDDFEDRKAELMDANNQVAKDQNEKYRSVTAAAAWGAVAGGVTGAWNGAKATKLGEIIPKAAEGWKKDVQNIDKLNKFYDDGGAQGVRGAVDRTVANVTKNVIGIDTPYQNIMASTKPMDQEIKDIEARTVLTKDVDSTVSSGEDRLKSKVYESKTLARNGKIATGLRDSSGKKILINDITAGETVGQLVRRYDAKAEFSKSEADAAVKRANDTATEAQSARAIAKAAALDSTKKHEEIEKLENEARIKEEAAKNAKIDAENKSIQAKDDEFVAEQLKKNAARDVFTQILLHPNPESESSFDQVAVQSINNALRSIRLASQDADLREMVRVKLQSHSEGARLYEAFVTGNIKSFDDMDDIKSAVASAQNDLLESQKRIKEEKRRIESSVNTASKKSAQDYNGSGK